MQLVVVSVEWELFAGKTIPLVPSVRDSDVVEVVARYSEGALLQSIYRSKRVMLIIRILIGIKSYLHIN
jgi:hypothetical protein